MTTAERIVETMRNKTKATAEAIKAAAPVRPPCRSRLDYVIQVFGSGVKRGGAFGHNPCR
jgi:hypothetical protein